MFGFHGPELIIILVVALLIFGPKKLPEMGSAIGKSLKEFRKGMNEITAPKDSYEDERPNLAISTKEIDKLVSAQANATPEVVQPTPTVYAEPAAETSSEVTTEHLGEEVPVEHAIKHSND